MVPQNCSVSHILQNIFLCARQKKRHPYRFGTTCGWVNDDRINIFGLNIPLIRSSYLKDQQLWFFFSDGCSWLYVTIIFSCGLHVNIFYVKYLIQVSTKQTITLFNNVFCMIPLILVNWLTAFCRFWRGDVNIWPQLCVYIYIYIYIYSIYIQYVCVCVWVYVCACLNISIHINPYNWSIIYQFSFALYWKY